MLDSPRLRDVMIMNILPLVGKEDLISLYNTCRSTREEVLAFKSWPKEYARVFPSDSEAKESVTFKKFMSRLMEVMQMIPNKSVVVCVSSRFHTAILSIEGRVYLGPKRDEVPDVRVDRLWNSSNNIYALSGQELLVWKYLDHQPNIIRHSLELHKATIIRSAEKFHAAYIPGTGVTIWQHVHEQTIVHTATHKYSAVLDILPVKNGVLVMTRQGLDYFEGFSGFIRVEASFGPQLWLEMVDFHAGLVAIVSATNRVVLEIAKLGLISLGGYILNTNRAVVEALAPSLTAAGAHPGASTVFS